MLPSHTHVHGHTIDAVTDLQRLNTVLAGRYALEREVGHGGMATVYLARDERHERVVAVKVLRPDLTAALGSERFLREIRIAAALQHPHILTLIDSGTADGLLYYVMPFVEGQSLRDRLASGPLPVSEAVRYLRDVFDALSHAHAQGIVHRDVKPDNIMISARHALVVDFGVAKAMSAAKQQLTGGGPEDGLTQIGTSIGTPAYMAPEQAAGDPDVNHSADIYAAGIVAYEMLAGRPPFVGSPQQVLAAQIHKTPEDLATVAPHVPPSLARLVMTCLEKEREHRFPTADAALQALESHVTPPASDAAARGDVRLSKRTLGAIAAAAVILVGAGAWAMYSRVREERWAHTVAIPEITQLVDRNQFESAFVLATRAERVLGDDSVLARLWPRLSTHLVLTSEPAGARVYRTTYNDSIGWTELGVTPTDSVRVPLGLSRWRFDLPGHHSVHLAGPPAIPRTTRVALQRMDSSDGRMVLVPAGNAEVAMPGLSRLPIIAIPEFYIDRHEVTNAEYKKFVDAGGYAKDEFWEHPVGVNGRSASGAEARSRFVDRTGRPGPATWEGGDFPAGQGDLPVTGVSWYEAAAYAKFVGKSLPTLYHWNRAATTVIGASIIPGSNYGGQGPARGSTFRGMSGFGSFDMAGNVREWVMNATADKRFILGGGWSDGSYSFSDAYAQSPTDRAALNGIRLVKGAKDGLGGAELAAAVTPEFRDYAVEKPVSDAVFEGFRGFFEYDRTPLNARPEYRRDNNPDWVRERVSFDAAYGGERMAAVLFIPKNHAPPYQTVVVMGGSNFLYTRSDSAIGTRIVDYVVKSGRMVVWPIYKGMFERNIGLTSDSPQETSAYRDLMVALVKDTRRTIDYLATRPDVDTARIAYYGVSFGGRVSPPILAMEPRFKAAMLNVAGLKMERARREVDPINFLPRVRLPMLMLNGRYDYYFPVETSQKPFFESLGTPTEHKKWVLYPEAHVVSRTETMREVLAWLDKYLGVVKQ